MIALGVQTWSTDVTAVERVWRAADACGYARITYGDGLWDFTHDGWTMLGALALATRRARIGPAVTYAFDAAAHHPSWLAKRAVTVDHLSGGRLDLRLAVGAEDAATRSAWEHHGIRYPAVGERLVALEHAIDIVRALWRGETVDADGAFHLREARLAPPPLQRPGPPVWIAAMRPRALALAARRADGWEASYVSPRAFASLAARFDAVLAAAGDAANTTKHADQPAPPRAVRRSVEVDVALVDSRAEATMWRRRFCAERGLDDDHPLLATALIGDRETVLEGIRAYAAAGATDLMLGFADFPATTMLERLARAVVPG
jgi:alkanesulfonate monooxygenase SsuD/methylene tetrahydromethanopterin reductase-like flavin-dependent oxidoreductase (luciferase family)